MVHRTVGELAVELISATWTLIYEQPSRNTTVPLDRCLKAMTREETDQKIVELARKYVETHDPEIREEIYKLASELEKLEKGD
jgi:hypothetical protein